MAIDLPSVNQEWRADASPYEAAMEQIIAAAEAAAAATNQVTDALMREQAAIGEGPLLAPSAEG